MQSDKAFNLHPAALSFLTCSRQSWTVLLVVTGLSVLIRRLESNAGERHEIGCCKRRDCTGIEWSWLGLGKDGRKAERLKMKLGRLWAVYGHFPKLCPSPAEFSMGQGGSGLSCIVSYTEAEVRQAKAKAGVKFFS